MGDSSCDLRSPETLVVRSRRLSWASISLRNCHLSGQQLSGAIYHNSTTRDNISSYDGFQTFGDFGLNLFQFLHYTLSKVDV